MYVFTLRLARSRPVTNKRAVYLFIPNGSSFRVFRESVAPGNCVPQNNSQPPSCLAKLQWEFRFTKFGSVESAVSAVHTYAFPEALYLLERGGTKGPPGPEPPTLGNYGAILAKTVPRVMRRDNAILVLTRSHQVRELRHVQKSLPLFPALHN